MSVIDADTRKWIRNASDEKAAAAGMRFNQRRGEAVCEWVEKNLCLYEGDLAGTPFTLREDWQYEATMRLFGWVQWFEWRRKFQWIRRFTRASIWIPKKQGKSPSLAALGVYLTCGDGEPGNKFYFAAKDGGQAREIAGKHAIEMVKASPTLQSPICEINLSHMQITHGPSRSLMKPISSGDTAAAKAKEGLNGSVGIDETHVVDAEFVSRITRAGISRKEPLFIEVSTAGKDPDSYGKRQYDYGKLVEAGERTDHNFFFLCYEAPQQLSDKDLAADPLKYGRMANPAMGRITNEREFLADYERSKESLGDLADFKTYRLNIWQQAASPWIRKDAWLACRREYTEADMEGQSCCAGLDLAITRDMSALAFVFPLEDDRFRSLVYFFMPEVGVQRLALKVPQVLEWVRDGHIIVTPGETTDYRFIREVFAEKCGIFQVEKLIYDEHFAEQVTNEMSELTGVERFKLPQTITRLNEPCQNMERAILDGKWEHNGNPAMTWQMGHVNIKGDANGNKRPVKPKNEDHKKIDGVLACIDALVGARATDPDDDWFAADQASREPAPEGAAESEWA